VHRGQNEATLPSKRQGRVFISSSGCSRWRARCQIKSVLGQAQDRPASDPHSCFARLRPKACQREVAKVSTQAPALKDTWPPNDEGMVELNGLLRSGPPPSPGWLRLRKVHRLNRHTLYPPVGRFRLTPCKIDRAAIARACHGSLQLRVLHAPHCLPSKLESPAAMSCRIGPLAGLQGLVQPCQNSGHADSRMVVVPLKQKQGLSMKFLHPQGSAGGRCLSAASNRSLASPPMPSIQPVMQVMQVSQPLLSRIFQPAPVLEPIRGPLVRKRRRSVPAPSWQWPPLVSPGGGTLNWLIQMGKVTASPQELHPRRAPAGPWLARFSRAVAESGRWVPQSNLQAACAGSGPAATGRKPPCGAKRPQRIGQPGVR